MERSEMIKELEQFKNEQTGMYDLKAVASSVAQNEEEKEDAFFSAFFGGECAKETGEEENELLALARELNAEIVSEKENSELVEAVEIINENENLTKEQVERLIQLGFAKVDVDTELLSIDVTIDKRLYSYSVCEICGTVFSRKEDCWVESESGGDICPDCVAAAY